MKQTKFFWAWNDEPATADRAMTRKRAATLLRSWRANARTAGRVSNSGFTLSRLGKGIYRVRLRSGQAGTMFIGRASEVANDAQ